MNLAQFLAGRLAKGIVVLFAIAVLNFFLIRAAPGDPAQVLAGEAGAADEQLLIQLRERFGLDQPLLTQLWVYLKGYLTFDLGFSYRQQQSVLSLILDRLPATLLLTGAAFIVSLGLGTLMGALAARRAGRWQDSVITTLALVFYATPLFWVALMSQIVFSLKLGLVPNVGYESIGANYTGLARALDIASHLVLPALTLGLFFTALYARMMRASMLEVAGADFVKTARAKGLSPGVISRRHVARNAILPVVTLAGLQAGQLVGGAVLTETVFAWPGIGRLMFDALVQRDYSVLLGVFFISSAMVVGFNILTDIVYRLADPRIEAVS
ncbi:Peptide/nickel transport system permease protein [Bosea sp. 62]|uniref:ABC transporter permease n=1 Tax=unclassified Bosea (in: a-proteobacteria) TaxID=2653178 RepID=UPI0012531CE7|nr:MULTISPECIES: ABC transporter permease [unclassified Bosea (in: a-proteobacteria)]CAD5282469.1 Peptide/nickel transport system permease protein [Bosea sp. 46]CAD5290984.1 Peptide/nickel transport system permease protein [Bosea sp. 21B]CAD5300497.1 Peptide/nickel transport system permease protein [Bosea sp. 7B]VVT59329.1 Peptide/nickel transport system permease protein [Bosea sp. EC-HK365B]VXB06612.1 Peptide/nickel transport system permease protein [Bosea sp. 125]